MTREDIIATEAAIKAAEESLKGLTDMRDEINADITKTQRAINAAKRKLDKARKIVGLMELSDQLKNQLIRKTTA